MFAPLGFVRGLTDEQVSALGDPARAPFAGLPTIEQAVESGSWLCGPPDLIAEKLIRMQEMYPGLEEVNMGNVIGTPQNVILEQLDWFARDVMPNFKAKAATAAAAGD